MSLSRRARRGIANFNARLKSPKQQMYASKRMEIRGGQPAMEPNILGAALAAVEAINADVQAVPKHENVSVAPQQEGGAEYSLPAQQKVGEEVEEGTQGGPK